MMTGLLSRELRARRFSYALAPRVSRAIGISRLICIFGVVYVHAWTGVGGDVMAAQAGSRQDIIRWTVVELFGRSAVPLLSVISGWLIGSSLAKHGAGPFIAGKARVLLVPLLLWNMLAMLLVVGAGMLGMPNVPLLGGPLWLADNLIDLTRSGDINVQTAFLRDLFLCMLAAPLLVCLSTRALLLIAAVAAVWIIGGWQFYLLLRPGILLFFIVGIVARRHGLAEQAGKLPFWKVILPLLAVLPFKIGLSILGEGVVGYRAELVNGVDLLLRAAAALLVWRTAMELANRRFGTRMLAFERYAFVLFCSHLIFMWLIAPFIGVAFGRMGSPAWPAYFLIQPALALGFAVIVARMMEAVSPKMADLLSGGRLG